MKNVELLYDDEEFRRIYYNGIETNYMNQFEATTLAANLRKRELK